MWFIVKDIDKYNKKVLKVKKYQHLSVYIPSTVGRVIEKRLKPFCLFCLCLGKSERSEKHL